MKFLRTLLEEPLRWKKVRGWPYEVSENGDVRHEKSKHILSPWKHTGRVTTYLRVTLRKGKKRKNYRVHRLVAMAFVPNPDRRPQVDHLDDNAFNNHYTNLEWVSASENLARRKQGSATEFKEPNFED